MSSPLTDYNVLPDMFYTFSYSVCVGLVYCFVTFLFEFFWCFVHFLILKDFAHPKINYYLA